MDLTTEGSVKSGARQRCERERWRELVEVVAAPDEAASEIMIILSPFLPLSLPPPPPFLSSWMF
jgi:hypothetical protein